LTWSRSNKREANRLRFKLADSAGWKNAMKRLVLFCAALVALLPVVSLEAELISVGAITVVDGDTIDAGPHRGPLDLTEVA
jgi:hypothetical protein